MNECNHDFFIYVHNVPKNINEFMCSKCGWAKSDEKI